MPRCIPKPNTLIYPSNVTLAGLEKQKAQQRARESAGYL